MIFFDTHTHLYDSRLMADEGQIARALAAGVQYMYMPNCNSETIDGMMSMAEKWPQHCLPGMGLHPCYVKEDYKTELDIVAAWLQKRPFSAVGEIGLDYYWDLTWKEQQIEAFQAQIDMALQYDIPIVIHSRESTQDCLQIVKDRNNSNLRGIFHCYSGTLAQAQEIVRCGFHLGIGGVVTYKKSGLDEIVRDIPLQHLVLETDAPYLAPVPHRGRRNESAYIPVIADAIAAIKNIAVATVADVTTANALAIFGMSKNNL
jgi:TatD DNase family protein